MKKVLIDTDVLLDFFFDRKPFADAAEKILSLCEKKEIQGFVTAVIISNVYYLLRQNAKHEKVIENLSQLLDILEIINIDKKVIQLALQNNWNDFEDALQNYAALKNGNIDAIITRNIKDFKESNLAIMQPLEFLKTMKTMK